MTQPDKYFPGDAANAGSFAAFAAKTQADWEAEQRNAALASFAPAEQGFAGLLNLVSFIPFIGPQIAQALLGQESTVDDLRGWSAVLHKFLPVLGSDPDVFDLGAAARDFIHDVLNIADGGIFNLDLIPNLGQDKLAIPNVQEIVDNIVQGGGGASTGNPVDEVLERIGGIFDTANRADQNAIAIQSAVQEIIADDQSSGGSGGVSFNVVFQGADGATLPGFTVGPAPGDIVIRTGNVAGLRSDAPVGDYWAAFDETYTADDQSVAGVFGQEGSDDIVTCLLARSDPTLTNGAWIGAQTDALFMGSYTRSGSVFTLNTIASISVDITIGARVEMRCIGSNYFGFINSQQFLSFNDSGGAITVGPTNRTPGFVYFRRDPFLEPIDDSFWLAAFAMADISTGGGGANVPSWEVSRPTTDGFDIGAITNGLSALMPTGFFTVQGSAVDVTVTDLGKGIITITEAGWYEITASIVAAPNDNDQPKFAGHWAVYKNGSQFSGAIPSGVSKKLFLVSGDTVQPGIVSMGATPTYIGLNEVGVRVQVRYVHGYASFSGRIIQAA